MILEIFILLEVLMLVNFYLAYFFKHELLWGISFVLSAILMLSSYNIEILQNGIYITHSLMFILGVNMIFFFLSLLLGILDFYDRYGEMIE